MPKKTLTSINVPPDVNTWESLQEQSQFQPNLGHVVTAMWDMFSYFGISESEQSKMGDLVQRFSMMLALNGDIALDTDDARLHALADMTEWFQRRAEFLLEA